MVEFQPPVVGFQPPVVEFQPPVMEISTTFVVEFQPPVVEFQTPCLIFLLISTYFASFYSPTHELDSVNCILALYRFNQ